MAEKHCLAARSQVSLLTKRFRRRTFRGLGVFCFFFTGRCYGEIWKGLRFAMDQDNSVAGPNHGELFLTPWSVVPKAVQSQVRRAPPWVLQALAP